jgi:hypothetical protein
MEEDENDSRKTFHTKLIVFFCYTLYFSYTRSLLAIRWQLSERETEGRRCKE